MYDRKMTHQEVEEAVQTFVDRGRRITTLYPSHVNHTGRQVISARTRENKIDRSLKDYLPDNLLDLMVQ